MYIKKLVNIQLQVTIIGFNKCCFKRLADNLNIDIKMCYLVIRAAI